METKTTADLIEDSAFHSVETQHLFDSLEREKPEDAVELVGRSVESGATPVESGTTNEELQSAASKVFEFCDQTLAYMSRSAHYARLSFEQRSKTLSEELTASIDDLESISDDERNISLLFAGAIEGHLVQRELDGLPPRHVQSEFQRREARELVHREVEFNHEIRDFIYRYPNLRRPTIIGWIERLTKDDTSFAVSVVDGAACEVATMRMLEEEGFSGRARFTTIQEDYNGADIVVDVADSPNRSMPVKLDVKASGRVLGSHLPVTVGYDEYKRVWVTALNKTLLDQTSHFRNPKQIADYCQEHIFSRYTRQRVYAN